MDGIRPSVCSEHEAEKRPINKIPPPPPPPLLPPGTGPACGRSVVSRVGLLGAEGQALYGGERRRARPRCLPDAGGPLGPPKETPRSVACVAVFLKGGGVGVM